MTNVYVELDKIKAVHEKSKAIGQFLDWTREQGMFLCRWQEDESVEDSERPFPIQQSIEKLLAQYFNIDLDQAEQERRQVLESFVEQQKRDKK